MAAKVTFNNFPSYLVGTHNRTSRDKISAMISLVCLVAYVAVAASTAIIEEPVAVNVGVVAPAYSQHIGPGGAVVAANPDYTYSVSDVSTHTGSIKQQSAVGKDALGGRSIRHYSQATHTDPISGQTDVKHDEHAFHINPYYGQAAVRTNKAEGSLNPAIGHAAFEQKSHDSQIAPGHASVADSLDAAAVSPHSNAASQSVHQASTDVVPGGIAHASHTAHKSHSNVAGIGGVAQLASATKKSFDGEGYGALRYNTHAASRAYDPYGHESVNEAGYNLDSAYDARVGLGSSNEVEYNRHAAHDPYGNYGAVTHARQAAHGGHLIPAYTSVVYKPPASLVYGPKAYVPAAHAIAVPAAYYHY